MVSDRDLESEFPRQALMRAMSNQSMKKGPKFGISILPPEAEHLEVILVIDIAFNFLHLIKYCVSTYKFMLTSFLIYVSFNYQSLYFVS